MGARFIFGWVCIVMMTAGTASGQPYFFSGTVKTPTGAPISGARVWYTYYGSGPLAGTGASVLSSAAGNYGDASTGYLPFNGGYYDIWLRVSKAGYEFRPFTIQYGSPTEYPGYYWTKSQGPYSNTVRNFTGAAISPMTSGMTASGGASGGSWTYYSTDVPSGASELRVDYKGTGDSTLKAQQGDWPTATQLASPAPKPAGTPTTRSIVLNASSNPPIQAGHWYLGVYSLEQTSFTLKTTMSSAAPPPVITGRVTHFNGVTTTGLAGIRVVATNGATSATTNSSGNYQITTPYNWSGRISVDYPTGRFLPTSHPLTAVTANQSGLNFSGPQYYLTINSPYGNPAGAGWYDTGTTASWSVTTPSSGGAGVRYMTTTPSGSVLMTGPKTVTVTWKIQYLLSTSATPAQMGWISPPSGWFYPGSVAAVSATPASGYKFVNFSGDLTGSLTPQSLSVNGPKTVTANFAPIVVPTPTPTPTPVPGRIQVPFEKKTIQQAIDAAQPGNTVLVFPGTYRENINLKGKNITVRSTAWTDPTVVAATVIDGTTTALAAVVTFSGAELSTCTLMGFTIKNGRGNFGGGICGNNTRATISYNVITNNSAVYNYADFSGEGGGINRCNGAIHDCTITSNTAEYGGGGVAECSGIIDKCVVSFNYATGGYNGGGFCNCDDALISNCLVYGNSAPIGGGFAYLDHGFITNCTIVKNRATSDWASWGGGIYCYYAKVTLKNSIVWGNTGVKLQSGNPIYWYQYMNPSAAYVSNTCIQDWDVTANGCISTDPKFIDAANNNFLIAPDSPCVDTGTIVSLTEDIRGAARPYNSKFDMGAYEYAAGPLPDKPAIVTLPASTQGLACTIAWGAASAAKYTAQISKTADFASPLESVDVAATGAIIYSATFTNLTDGKFYYRVRGENTLGNPGSWSNVVSSTQDATAPSFSSVAASPSSAYAGVNVNITFSASEALAADPVVKVNGKSATRTGKVNNNYTYRYTTQAAETVGPATIAISGSDLVGYPCAVTNTTALRFLTNPVAISNLTPAGYSTDVLDLGKLVYADRAYTFQSPMISSLQYNTYIKPLQADKDSTSLKVQFTVNQPVIVVVGIAENITTPPAWLNGWLYRGDKLKTNDGTTGRVLYEKKFLAGQITLGANRDSSMPTGRSMYTVVILPSQNTAAEWVYYR